jgi:O-antigen ligase
MNPSVADAIRLPQYRSGEASLRPCARTRQLGVVLLCAVPLIDPVIDQVHNALLLSFGPFSLPQIVRSCLMVLAWALLLTEGRPSSLTRRISPATFTMSLIFLAVTAREIATTGQFNVQPVVACFQIIYWCTMWTLAARTFTTARISRKVLTAFAFGGLITAGSVYWGYATGGALTQEYQDIRSSVGLFASGKGIAGCLAAAAFIFAYSSVSLRRRIYLLFAALCAVASFLTYARAGMVGLGVAAVWASAWVLIRTRPSIWVRRFVVLLTLSAVLVIALIGVKDFERRWADVNDNEKAGSGRVLMWRAASGAFAEARLSQQLFGRGIEGMYDLMESRTSMSIHTHSDFFDLLTIGGIVGLLGGLTVLVSIIRLGSSLRSTSPEYGLFWCIACIMAAQCLLTGQFFGPDSMTFFLVTMTATVTLNRPVLSRRAMACKTWRTGYDRAITV